MPACGSAAPSCTSSSLQRPGESGGPHPQPDTHDQMVFKEWICAIQGVDLRHSRPGEASLGSSWAASGHLSDRNVPEHGCWESEGCLCIDHGSGHAPASGRGAAQGADHKRHSADHKLHRRKKNPNARNAKQSRKILKIKKCTHSCHADRCAGTGAAGGVLWDCAG